MAEISNIRTGRLAPGLLLAAGSGLIYLAVSLTDLWGYFPPVIQEIVYILLFITIIISLLHGLNGKIIWPAPAELKVLGLLAILLAVAAILAGSDSQRLLEIALKPRAIFSYPVPEIIMTVTPPSYSGQKEFTENLSVGDKKSSNLRPIVQGSNITIRVINTTYAPTLIAGSQKVRFLGTETKGFTARFTLKNETSWQVREGSRRLGQWPILILKDNPPVIHQAVFHRIKTTDGLFVLSLDLSDDFGLQNGGVGVIPQGGSPNNLHNRTSFGISGLKKFSDEVYVDLSASDFAGRKVDLVVEVTDQAGQKSKKIISDITLPARNFSNPFARELIKIRQEIRQQPNARKKLARQLMALGLTGGNGQMPMIYYLALRSAYWRLISPENDGDITSARNILWTLAGRLEDGGRGRFTHTTLALLTKLKVALHQKQSIISIKNQLLKIDNNLISFLQRQSSSRHQRYLLEKYNLTALRKIYNQIISDSYYKKFTLAINLVSYLERGLAYNETAILSGQGYVHFRIAQHARKTVNTLEKSQKQVMNFILEKTVRLEIVQTKNTNILNIPQNKDIQIWITIQQKLGKQMGDLGRVLQKSGINAARFTVPAGDLAREVIHSMKDGDMSAAIGYQSQIMTILQSLGNMLDQEIYFGPKDL